MEANADRLIELFHEARARAAMGELDHFLGDRCCDEPELKGQLISLLQVHDQIGDFLQTGPPHLVSEIAAEKPGDKLGPYKLIEQIGEGGCGVVYLAEQEYPVRRRVALKVIKLGMDTRSVVARFEAERQALALMDHPHIAKVLEAGATATGRPYFVMELVRGARITEYCQQARLPIEQRLRLLIQICNAVQHAHQKGIIHRDLKPSNILVTLHDGAPVPKVIDFGIAKATADQRLTDRTVFTAVEQFLGTPAYMSPEQAEMGELDIDTRSDIYSLGVLLYELLTGHTPFDTQELTRSGLGEMRRIIREQEPVRPSTRFARGSDPRESQSRDGKSEIPQDLDWIVMKCLEKDRARRYSTANGLSADLERHLNNEPVVARPPSTSYRIQKAFRRHKWAFASASAVVAALVLGLFASLWLNMKATRAQHEAERQAYILKMNLARQAWDDNDIGRLRRLLQQTAAYRDRGFEWYYWQQQCHLELRTLRGHAAPVMDVSFSPDSKRVLTASLDGTAIVWDSNRGAEIRTFDGHHGGMTSAAWSPDGQKIVTAGASGTALIWDAVSGVQLVTLQGHSGRLTSARFSPDGERIVTASFDRTARVWRSATGEEILTLTNGSTVWSAAFSPNGQTIVTASSDETANVWNATNGSRLLTIRPSSARHPSMVGDYMAFYAGFSPDGSLIVTLGQNQVASFWDAVTGAWRFDLKGNPHWLSPRQTEVPLTVSFSHDNGRIIMGGLDFAPSVWRLEGYTNLFILKGHEAEIVASAFSPDGRRIVTGSYDHTAKIWNAAGTSEVTYLGGHTNIVVSSAYSPDGGRLATASWDGTANVWETANGALLFALNHGDTLVWCVAFSADGTRIVTGTQGGTWSVWDAFTSRQLLSITNSHGRELYSVGFSRDGNRVLTAGGDGTAKVWDASTGRELLVLPHNQPLVMAVFSPDGRRIASVCNDNNRNTLEEATAAVWDAQTGRKVFNLAGKHLNGFSAVAFSPDGRLIVTGSVDWTATVWDASNGKDLHVLRGHHGQVIHVGVSPDCQRIFTGGFDNTTRVWDVTTGQEMLTHKGRFFLGQGISPDGRRIVVGAEPPVIVWKVASPEQVAAWRAEERMLAKQMNADR